MRCTSGHGPPDDPSRSWPAPERPSPFDGKGPGRLYMAEQLRRHLAPPPRPSAWTRSPSARARVPAWWWRPGTPTTDLVWRRGTQTRRPGAVLHPYHTQAVPRHPGRGDGHGNRFARPPRTRPAGADRVRQIPHPAPSNEALDDGAGPSMPGCRAATPLHQGEPLYAAVAPGESGPRWPPGAQDCWPPTGGSTPPTCLKNPSPTVDYQSGPGPQVLRELARQSPVAAAETPPRSSRR